MIESAEEETKGQSNCSLQNLMDSYKDSGTNVLVVQDGTERFCSHKSCLARFSMNIRKTYFTRRIVQHRNGFYDKASD